MKVYVFSDPMALRKLLTSEEEVEQILNQVAEGTETTELVVAVYLSSAETWLGSYWRAWQDRIQFHKRRGKWAITTRFDIPADVPNRYRLIRLCIGAGLAPYPRRLEDAYGFRYRYASFRDHLADLFAHELHHYRRYHLGFHPREGEVSACRWALQHVTTLGFRVEGSYTRRRPRRSTVPPPSESWLLEVTRLAIERLSADGLRAVSLWCWKREKELEELELECKLEHRYKKIRALPAGARLVMGPSPAYPYGERVALVRARRKYATVQLQDGTHWNEDMAFLWVEKEASWLRATRDEKTMVAT